MKKEADNERKQTEDFYRCAKAESRKFKAYQGIKPSIKIAQEFGVHPTQVAQWKKELLTNAGSLFI